MSLFLQQRIKFSDLIVSLKNVVMSFFENKTIKFKNFSQ